MPNCPCPQFDIQKYRDVPYQQTPCASCFMTHQTNKTNKHTKLYDTDGAIDQTPSKRPQPVQVQDILPEQVNPQTLRIIMQACQQNFLIVLSNIVLKLVNLSKSYPVLFQILTYKMQHSQLSYYDIGRKLDPPCSKQNVLYHLSHAVREFPDLQKAIFTDTRFSGGRYALRTVAQLAARTKQVQRVRRLLYDDTTANRRHTFKQLQQQFKKPYKIQTISKFDAYLQQSDSKETSDADKG